MSTPITLQNGPDGGPAFPVECSFDKGQIYGGMQTGNSSGWVTGVTVRDYFAAHALPPAISYKPQGIRMRIRAFLGMNYGAPVVIPLEAAKAAYAIADAMLAAREAN